MTSSRDYKSESRREFDKVAPHYDKNSAFYYRITRWCDDAVIDRIGKMDAAFDRVLDVGCGTGVLLHKLSLCYPKVRFDGLDLSDQMIAQAVAKSLPNAVFSQGDAENPPYPDNTFDILMCTSSFHHYPNPQAAIQSFHRILKPGGLLILCDMALPLPIRFLANHLWFRIIRSGDVHTYSQTEITKLLNDHQFSQCAYKKISPVEFMITAIAAKGTHEQTH